MNVYQAKQLKDGDKIQLPPDRGEASFVGTVDGYDYMQSTINTNIHGTDYIWVHIKEGGLWPSNRISHA